MIRTPAEDIVKSSFTFFSKGDNGRLTIRPEVERIPVVYQVIRNSKSKFLATQQLQFISLYLDDSFHPSLPDKKRKAIIASLCMLDEENPIISATEDAIKFFQETTISLEKKASKSLADTLSASIDFLDRLRDKIVEMSETLDNFDTSSFSQEEIVMFDALIAKSNAHFKDIIATVKSVYEQQKLINQKEKEEALEMKRNGYKVKSVLEDMFDS